ncbi:hypothetical protein HDE_10081 [Halotydeus destructor]|nr:hypothetical protein HDE_10081 [Halotydeus destructor]
MRFSTLLIVAIVGSLLVADVIANPFFVAIARALGMALVKNTYYARCNTRNVPSGIRCPGVVFGAGPSRNLAQNAARAYAARSDARCAQYVGHCDIKKFSK